MSVPGGKADQIRTITDIQTTPDSHACYSVSASLWFGGLRSSRVTGPTSTGRYIRPETMTAKPLFNLDAEGRWRLANDSQQWVVQRRTQKPRVRRLEGHAIADSGWRGVSFIGGKKATLARVLGEKGVIRIGRCRVQRHRNT